MKRWFAVFGLALVAAASLPQATPVQAADPQPAAKGQTDLNPEDCNVFVVAGRQLLGWGQTPPDKTQFQIFYRPEGGGYVEQCPWKDLGVTPLPPQTPDLTSQRFFTAPRYSGDGLSATIILDTYIKGRVGAFISQTICTLNKIDGQWAGLRCVPGPIT